jgi:hypothetical protein
MTAHRFEVGDRVIDSQNPDHVGTVEHVYDEPIDFVAVVWDDWLTSGDRRRGARIPLAVHVDRLRKVPS